MTSYCRRNRRVNTQPEIVPAGSRTQPKKERKWTVDSRRGAANQYANIVIKVQTNTHAERREQRKLVRSGLSNVHLRHKDEQESNRVRKRERAVEVESAKL